MKRLSDVNLFNLTPTEHRMFEMFSRTMSKEKALELIVNSFKGDFSQTSKELLETLDELQESFLDKEHKQVYCKKCGTLCGYQ